MRPRGIKKDEAKVRLWFREVAPSDKLGRWFGHELAKCAEFRQRYFKELDAGDALLRQERRACEKPFSFSNLTS
ncbi:MAG: DUF488 family protein [Nitrospirae bacterium]|nr:DUF488 family protein [Nitrospirota bacterium]